MGVSLAAHGTSGDAGVDAGHDRKKPSGMPTDFRGGGGFTKVNRARFVSQGHAAGRYEVDIYANGKASDAYGSSSLEVPIGARLLKEHFERVGDGVIPGPVMMMEKMEKGFDPDHGDWRYVVVTSSGDLVEDGRVESCAGCHDDAPHDHIFRVE